MEDKDKTGRRQFDVVIFGATAFTGQFVVEELAMVTQDLESKRPTTRSRSQHPSSSLTWAIAGRSRNKLTAVLKKASSETGQDLSKIDIVLADIDDLESLKKMAKQTKIILTLVGPYTLYGEGLVQACIAEGTHCLDLSWETNFLEKMQVNYGKKAEQAGVYIVGACGLDCIPGDCGVSLLQKKFGDNRLNSVEIFWEMNYGWRPPRTHYGTWHSKIQNMAYAHELVGLRKSLFSKEPPKPHFVLENRGLLHYSNKVKGWCVPFPGIDLSVVNRSQYFLYDKKKIGRPVQTDAYMKLPLILCLLALIGGYLFRFICQFELGRHILETYPRLCTFGFISHEGGTKQELNNCECKITLVGRGWKNDGGSEEEKYPPNLTQNVVFQCRDPGYSSTAKMFVQAGLTILEESDRMPGQGGVLPPGAAFAETSLVDKINSRGVVLKIVS